MRCGCPWKQLNCPSLSFPGPEKDSLDHPPIHQAIFCIFKACIRSIHENPLRVPIPLQWMIFSAFWKISRCKCWFNIKLIFTWGVNGTLELNGVPSPCSDYDCFCWDSKLGSELYFPHILKWQFWEGYIVWHSMRANIIKWLCGGCVLSSICWCWWNGAGHLPLYLSVQINIMDAA